MNKCPCCGTETEAKFIVSLDINTVAIGGMFIKCSPREAEIFKVLADAFPAPATTERLTSGVYGQTQSATYLTIQVIVSRLNKKIARTGHRISNIYGVGYILTQLREAAA